MKYHLLWLVPVCLVVAFAVLKMCSVISWSWWWVFAPVWVPIALIVILAVYVVYALKQENIDLSEYDWR